LSWEQLTADADARNKIRATETLNIMVACQGDVGSWENLQQAMLKIINH
jgi:hypothetical protein